MFEIYQTINILSFIQDYFQWVSNLTVWQLIGVISFVLPDLLRNMGKPIALGLHLILRRVHPLAFENIDNAQIKISVIIPAHNEGSSIRKTIDSVLDNTYPNKEIIVVDDHSSDDTFQQAYPYHKHGQIKLVKRMVGKGAKAGAANFGAVFATGDVLLIMDGDTLLERNALRHVAKFMSISDVVAVAGNVRVLSGDDGVINLLTKCQSYEYLIAFELGRRIRLMLNILVVIPGAFGAFKRSAATKVGFYDKDTMTEDFDMGIKILKTGGRVEFVPDAIAWTYCPNNWTEWMNQRIRWSHGQFTTLRKHRDTMSGRSTYKALFSLSMIDMVFTDIILLILRIASSVWMVLTFQQSIIFPFVFIMMIYIVNEFIVIMTAIGFSLGKGNVRFVYLFPFMVFVYRPLYSYIRFYSYLVAPFKKEMKW